MDAILRIEYVNLPNESNAAWVQALRLIVDIFMEMCDE